MADEGSASRSNQAPSHQPGSVPSNRGEPARLGPGPGAIAVLSLRAGRGRATGFRSKSGSTRYAAGATIAARALSTKALSSACSRRRY